MSKTALPGITNKFLSKYVNKVAICFDEAKSHFPSEKVVFTGNPRASEVVSIKTGRSLAEFGLTEDKKTVLIFGGSRGAAAINRAVVEMQEALKTREYQVLYITGEVHYEKVMGELQSAGGAASNMVTKPFLHQMPEYLKAIDVIVARAGATTIAEITALGIPSVLIPSPYVTANHQEVNAQALSQHDAAIVLKETELSGDKLINALDRIVLDEDTLKDMSERTKSLGVPDAAARLYNVLEELKNKRRANGNAEVYDGESDTRIKRPRSRQSSGKRTARESYNNENRRTCRHFGHPKSCGSRKRHYGHY